MAEQNAAGWSTPYKFTGKEMDDITGLYYFGARYYDPRISLWMSVDPLAEKYPGWSAYSYTFDNPVKFVDPDGMGPNDPLPNTHYAVIAIFGKKLDDVTQQRYNEAVAKGIPIIQVSGKKELSTAMANLKKQGTSTNAYIIAQHGNKNLAYIGDERVNNKSEFKDLKNGFKGKNIVLIHCNITKDCDPNGMKLIQNLGKDSKANAVLSNDHLGWGIIDLQGKKEGNWGLTYDFPFLRREDGDGQYFNDYHISLQGKPAQQVYNAKLNFGTGTIIWNPVDNETEGLRTPDNK